MDVLENGEIHWVAGGKDHAWVSLSRIAFPVASGGSGSADLPLVNGWQHYGANFQGGKYRMVDGSGFCFVKDLIKGGSWGHLATLPPGCRPEGDLIFNMSNHQNTALVTVKKNAEVRWEAGGKDHGWVSLSGIAFSVEAGGD